MSSVGCPNGVLQQATQLWSMLDDLSQDDPKAYINFIEKHVKEGLELSAPPQVHSCLQTEILGPKHGVLFINICSWKRVPPAKDVSHPIPVCGGRLETHMDSNGDRYSVLDVAFSPSELHQAAQRQTREGEKHPQVYLLALSLAQRQHGLSLSEQFRRTSDSPKGSLEDVHQRLGFRQQPGRPAPGGARSPPDAVSSPSSLLQHMSSLRMEDRQDPLEPQSTQIVVGLAAAAEENKKKALIQVISSTSAPQQLQQPQFQLLVIPGAKGRVGDVVELTALLPRVVSVSECELSVSQTDVLLEVDDLYRLLVDLPELVDENSASATFNKKERRLTLRLDVLRDIGQLKETGDYLKEKSGPHREAEGRK